MLNPAVFRWVTRGCAMGALLLLFGCSSTKPYTLTAQLPPNSQQARIVAATIDVEGSSCSVRVVTLDSNKAWTPVCLVMKEQPTYKSFSIAGQEVDFGAVDSGFKVLSTALPTLPAPSATAAPAANIKAKASKSAVATTTSAAGTTAPAATIQTFPTDWNLTPYPGHVKLQGQNTGFLIASATLTISGSYGFLTVIYKTTYPPLQLPCTVTANEKGDFTLQFNPAEAVKLSQGGNPTILLSSEGQSISGNIWDSRGFDTWTPSLPPQWIAASYSSD